MSNNLNKSWNENRKVDKKKPLDKRISMKIFFSKRGFQKRVVPVILISMSKAAIVQ